MNVKVIEKTGADSVFLNQVYVPINNSSTVVSNEEVDNETFTLAHTQNNGVVLDVVDEDALIKLIQQTFGDCLPNPSTMIKLKNSGTPNE
ncbi:hypothetical protein FACS189459_6790 [Bacilli bacterium]|nr:hypothetical protein FACS189459_6790 [Bacilli bacterium]